MDLPKNGKNLGKYEIFLWLKNSPHSQIITQLKLQKISACEYLNNQLIQFAISVKRHNSEIK